MFGYNVVGRKVLNMYVTMSEIHLFWAIKTCTCIVHHCVYRLMVSSCKNYHSHLYMAHTRTDTYNLQQKRHLALYRTLHVLYVLYSEEYSYNLHVY